MCRRDAWVVSWFRCFPRLSDIRYSTRVQTKLASPSWRPIRRACPPFTRFVEQDGTGLVVDMQDTYYPSSNLHTFLKYVLFLASPSTLSSRSAICVYSWTRRGQVCRCEMRGKTEKNDARGNEGLRPLCTGSLVATSFLRCLRPVVCRSSL